MRKSIYINISLLFAISALYFFYFGNHIFSYQDNEILFVYSGEYLLQYLSKPGGMLEYAANFLAQVYFSPFLGSLVLASIFTLIAFAYHKTGKEIYGEGPFLGICMVLPSCLLILLQTDFNYQLHNLLGFLIVSYSFLLSVKSKKRVQILTGLALFPAFFFLAGGYMWIFAGMYILYYLLNNNIFYPLILSVTAVLTVFLCSELFFFQPLHELICYPLPQITVYKIPLVLYLLYGLFIVYPVLLKVLRWIRMKPENIRSMSFYLDMVLFSATIFLLSRLYNPEMNNLFKLERLVYSRNWNEVIKNQEKNQSRNIVAQYYYNLALSETNQLCDRLFYGRQDYGPRSLMVQWDSKANINQIFRGAYFFYSIGLINEAHRWAFESMVIQGYRPENIKMLIKTDLINGHYKVAEKYIRVLKRTIRYRKWAEQYEKMLFHPEVIQTDPELSEKIRLQPKDDFIIRIKEQQDNVILLLQSNPENKKAFEYMMAWYLLEKNTGKAVEEIKKMKGMGYIRLPRHLEEAAIFFQASSTETPDLGGITISKETENRYSQYESAATRFDNLLTSAVSDLRITFGNTYWYYFSGFK